MVKTSRKKQTSKKTSVVLAVLMFAAGVVLLVVFCAYMTRSNENLDIEVVPPTKIEPGPSPAPINADAEFEIGARGVGQDIKNYWNNFGKYLDNKWDKFIAEQNKLAEQNKERQNNYPRWLTRDEYDDNKKRKPRPPTYYQDREKECIKQGWNWYPNDAKTWAGLQARKKLLLPSGECWEVFNDNYTKTMNFCCDFRLPKFK